MEENVLQINGGIMINVSVSVKNVMYVKKIVWNPSTCNYENGKYLANIMDDSAIMCDEFTESYDEDVEAKWYDETNFNEKKATCHTQNFYNLLVFLLITIALLIAGSIYCYLIKKHYHSMSQITN